MAVVRFHPLLRTRTPPSPEEDPDFTEYWTRNKLSSGSRTREDLRKLWEAAQKCALERKQRD